MSRPRVPDRPERRLLGIRCAHRLHTAWVVIASATSFLPIPMRLNLGIAPSGETGQGGRAAPDLFVADVSGTDVSIFAPKNDPHMLLVDQFARDIRKMLPQNTDSVILCSEHTVGWRYSFFEALTAPQLSELCQAMTRLGIKASVEDGVE